MFAGDFMYTFDERCNEFIKNMPTGSHIRIFFFLAINQPPDVENCVVGFKCSRKFIQDELKLRRPTVWAALKYLEDELLVNESIINGQTEFLVNPYYVMVGDDKQRRIDEWKRRVTLDNEKRREKRHKQ